MAKRLHMTTADYLVIAISPALIMALVGSLVYFLIEVFYAGEYTARLDYSFGLFVFAAVLIARISIEMGSEQALLYGLALGGAMFLFLTKFVEHPSPFSHLINIGLMAIVWWCAHKLTWDSTVIDDAEDASGAGLMQRVGADGPEKAEEKKVDAKGPRPDGTKENELLETSPDENSTFWQRLKRLVGGKKGPHTPGVWVFYFSLAALPLFGVGQHWIPAAETGRRAYAFSLLLVYVASALALLVTTSFLNLRRYLRQRRIEMPLPIAGTWVAVGGALIVIVMMLAMLIPRPGAEVALSKVPWQAGSPEGLSASQMSLKNDGGEEQKDQKDATAGEKTAEEGSGNAPPNGKPSENKSNDPNAKDDSGKQQGEGEKSSTEGKSGKQKDDAKKSDSPSGPKQRGETTKEKNDPKEGKDGKDGKSPESGKSDPQKSEAKNQSEKSESKNESKSEAKGESKSSGSPPASRAVETLKSLPSLLGGLAGLLKILFYLAAAICLGIAMWKYRREIMQAISDILRMLRELFGGRRADDDGKEEEAQATKARLRSFADFRDPFQTGQAGQMPPEELVRYTFAAFEAWANDRGRPRTPDCTPQELIAAAVEPKTPMYNEARKLVRLYGELAYASRRVPRGAADELREVWDLMRSTQAVEIGAVKRRRV